MKISPCKNCEKRHIKCHSDCEEYKAWVEEERAEKSYNFLNRRSVVYSPASEKRHDAYIRKHAGHWHYKKG